MQMRMKLEAVGGDQF